MKTSHLLALTLLGAALSRPALAQTTPAATPGTPIDPSNPTAAPATPSATVVPGQPGTPPPVATPPGTVYPPAATGTKSTKKMRTQRPAAKPNRAKMRS